MTRWLLLAGTECTDVSKEEEFNKWYDEIHVPDVLETPGFISGTRYVRTRSLEGIPKYLALYEIETADIDRADELLRENMNKKKAEGRWDYSMKSLWRVFYKEISTYKKGAGST